MSGVTPVPIGRLRDEVIGETVGGRHSQTTSSALRKIFRIAEALGARTTDDLTPELLDRFAAGLDGAESTQTVLLSRFRRVCGFAVGKKYLGRSPFESRPDLAERIRRAFPTVRKQPRLHSFVQFKDVLAYLESRAGASVVDHRLYTLAALVAFTGHTPSDVYRLKVADIDFQAGRILVPYRKAQRNHTPGVIPMAPDLVPILKCWLTRRAQPPGSKMKLDEVKAAELRRLKAEGWSTRDLAERFGVARTTIYYVLQRKSWGHVPCDGKVTLRVSDSEWLFPGFRPGTSGPLPSLDYRSAALLKGAGEAVGVENLRLKDLTYMFTYCVAPAIMMLKPEQAAPLADVSPVLLGAPRTRPMVLGAVMEVLTDAEYNVVRALLGVYPGGLSWPDLDKTSGHTYSRTHVNRLKSKHDNWNIVLKLPSETAHGDCRFVTP